ncbi:MAG: hypothetical protein LC722_08180 [Actinobacteria bacterium]|nr:hypothetical protein [Actinomycetota bacterium]
MPEPPPSTGISTLPDDDGIARAGRARWLRRIGIGALAIYVGLGFAGVFGVRSDSVSTSRGGYELSVQYPQVARPGLAAPWGIRVHRDGGFGDDPITVATSIEWLNLFDENGRNPAPSGEYMDQGMLVWEFDPPPGDTFRFQYDARLGPSVQSGMTATTELREGNVVLLTVTYRLRVFP